MKSNNRRRTVGTAFGVALVVVGLLADSTPRVTLAQPNGFDITLIATLGEPAPGGGNFTFDFEPSGVNSRGDVAFTADLTTGGEGVFVGHEGQVSQIMRHGQPAPGGDIFWLAELGRLGLNEGGDVALPFTLNGPNPALPFGHSSGIFRFSHSDKTLSAVALPGTPAPGGGTFAGVYFNTSLNNRGDIVFTGIVTGADIDPSSPPGIMGLGTGLFLADKHDTIFSVVRPGDPAPGGGTFDTARHGWINEAGDIAFGAHVAGEECIDTGSPLVCGESVYLKDAATGVIQSIAHQGDPAPGGGVYRLAFGAVVNSRGDIVFIGDLTPAPADGEVLGVFLFSKGATIAVARPDDAMPGGGTFVTAGNSSATYHLNNREDVSFAATLDTDVNGDSIPDTGLYVFSKGSVRLVARTGTLIPGLGTIAYLGLAPFSPSPLGTGGIINERGEVLFFATLNDGTGVLLIATPSKE